MEQHEKTLEVIFGEEKKDSVLNELEDLAKNTQARSLAVFKKADSIARTTSEMELFLRSRQIYENNRCTTKRIKQFGDKS